MSVIGNEFWRRIQVVKDKDTLVELGFTENRFKSWEYVLDDNDYMKRSVVIDGDYVFLTDRHKGDLFKRSRDLVTVLWSNDRAGQIPKDKLKMLTEILKQGNTWQD